MENNDQCVLSGTDYFEDLLITFSDQITAIKTELSKRQLLVNKAGLSRCNLAIIKDCWSDNSPNEWLYLI